MDLRLVPWSPPAKVIDPLGTERSSVDPYLCLRDFEGYSTERYDHTAREIGDIPSIAQGNRQSCQTFPWIHTILMTGMEIYFPYLLAVDLSFSISHDPYAVKSSEIGSLAIQCSLHPARLGWVWSSGGRVCQRRFHMISRVVRPGTLSLYWLGS